VPDPFRYTRLPHEHFSSPRVQKLALVLSYHFDKTFHKSNVLSKSKPSAFYL
jgi:hypothetical protein